MQLHFHFTFVYNHGVELEWSIDNTCTSITERKEMERKLLSGRKVYYYLLVYYSAVHQGHREFPFGKSREFDDPKIPAEFPGILRIATCNFFVQELSSQHPAALTDPEQIA